MTRDDWNIYFLKMAELVATRSTCARRNVGAVAVRKNRVLATGYNGAPPGHPHCNETGCLRQQMGIPSGERQELCRAVHAEANIVAQCAHFGVSLEHSTIYISGGTPCSNCARLLVTCGVSFIITDVEYPDRWAFDILKESNVPVSVAPELG